MRRVWKAYIPEDGCTAEDAWEVKPRWDWQVIYDAEDAAKAACTSDYSDTAGERGIDMPFVIAIIDGNGQETRWTATNVVEVEHRVVQIDDFVFNTPDTPPPEDTDD